MNIIEWIRYKIYNFTNNITYNKVINYSNINIGILLAAGTSSRFNADTPKQLYAINNNSIISYSINSLINIIDELIIITNTPCYNEIKELIKDNNKITLLINDINYRIISIKTGLVYINNKYPNINKVIIHDSARPYVTENQFKKILEITDKYEYTQYYLKLINGLVKKENTNYIIRNRDNYIEICTPICCNFNLYYFVFMNYIANKNSFTNEPITILNLMNIKYELIQGQHKYLRKITYLDDIF
jgi:2-C-methyl-D-erythritol 4-phosphate cytidylyltransferase